MKRESLLTGAAVALAIAACASAPPGGEARLSRPAVIGHSLGGSIGLMLAARHPDLVGRLMVVDMPPFVGVMFGPPGATPESVRAVADQIRARILSEPPGSPTGMLEQMIPSMTRIDTMRPMLAQGVRDSDRRTAANAFQDRKSVV